MPNSYFFFAIILSISNTIGTYIYFGYNTNALTIFQGYTRLISYCGIESTQLSIIFLNLLSFRFPVFMNRYKKTRKFIFGLIIYLPVFLYVLPEVIITLIRGSKIVLNDIGMCFFLWTAIYQYALDIFLEAAFLFILICLHFLIRKYFKGHSDYSEGEYYRKLKIYYISLFFTFPTALCLILDQLVGLIDKPSPSLSLAFVCFQTFMLEIFPLIVSVIFCFDWTLIKQLFCCRTKLIYEKISARGSLMVP